MFLTTYQIIRFISRSIAHDQILVFCQSNNKCSKNELLLYYLESVCNTVQGCVALKIYNSIILKHQHTNNLLKFFIRQLLLINKLFWLQQIDWRGVVHLKQYHCNLIHLWHMLNKAHRLNLLLILTTTCNPLWIDCWWLFRANR